MEQCGTNVNSHNTIYSLSQNKHDFTIQSNGEHVNVNNVTVNLCVANPILQTYVANGKGEKDPSIISAAIQDRYTISTATPPLLLEKMPYVTEKSNLENPRWWTVNLKYVYLSLYTILQRNSNG